jgi:hypothetical protein
MSAMYASLRAGLPLRVIARRNDEAIQGIKLPLWTASFLAMTAAGNVHIG